MKKSTSKESIGNSPVRHGWLAPSPVKKHKTIWKNMENLLTIVVPLEVSGLHENARFSSVADVKIYWII